MNKNKNLHPICCVMLVAMAILPASSLKFTARHLGFKDNLVVQNWHYGNITPMDYRIRLFEKAADEEL